MRKKGFELGWQYLIPIILALAVLFILLFPTVSWAKEGWKKIADKLTFWKVKTPGTVVPGTQAGFDLFNNALRNDKKYLKSDVTGEQFNNMKSILHNEQKMTSNGVDYYLISTTPDTRTTMYLIYEPKQGRVSVLSTNFPKDDTYIYSYAEASSAAKEKYLKMSTGHELTSMLRLECPKKFLGILSDPIDLYYIYRTDDGCCEALDNLCPRPILREALDGAIAQPPKK